MKKSEWELREHALNLFCTGKFGSKAEALKVAKAERERANTNRENANQDHVSPYDRDS